MVAAIRRPGRCTSVVAVDVGGEDRDALRPRRSSSNSTESSADRDGDHARVALVRTSVDRSGTDALGGEVGRSAATSSAGSNNTTSAEVASPCPSIDLHPSRTGDHVGGGDRPPRRRSTYRFRIRCVARSPSARTRSVALPIASVSMPRRSADNSSGRPRPRAARRRCARGVDLSAPCGRRSSARLRRSARSGRGCRRPGCRTPADRRCRRTCRSVRRRGRPTRASVQNTARWSSVISAAMPARSPAFCLARMPIGRAFEAGFVPDEGVVRCRPVERQRRPGRSSRPAAISASSSPTIVVTGTITATSPTGCDRLGSAPAAMPGSDVAFEVAGLADRVDVHAVGDLAGHREASRG